MNLVPRVFVLLLLGWGREYGRAFALSEEFDSFLARFIVDATPALFSPSRISMLLCVDEDRGLRLSRETSKSRLIHEIRGDFEGFRERLDDSYEHRNLYVLDLDCGYALRVLREWLLLRDGTVGGDTEVDEALEALREATVYPDSNVVLARRIGKDSLRLTSVYRPAPSGDALIEDRGTWSSTDGLRPRTHLPASRRRRDLRGTTLKSCLVMTDRDTINHLSDYRDKHIDAVTKVNYPRVVQLASRMNATVTFDVTNTWGYRSENGSWSGMIGMLHRREIDIGGTATFLVPERIGVVDYIPLYTRTGSRFVFRQPLLSAVSNIFTLPFQRPVWIAIGVLLFLVFVLLYLSTKWEYFRGASPSTAEYWKQLNPAEPTLSDNFLVVLGAVAQQGYSYEPYRVPSRIVTLMLLIAALSLYASYTANIVALLQSTTDSIRTYADLLESPLKFGAQDVVYNRYYFKTFQDPVRKAIVEQKIEPRGPAAWMDVQEGVRRMRNGLFAFHAEVGTVYKIVQETYREDEKCGIREIDFLNVLSPLLVVQKRSPYLEIVRNGALLLRESGLKFRDEYRLYTEKPKCHGQTSFVSIGLTECYFALVSLGYGLLLTLLVLALEFLWHGRRKTEESSAVQKRRVSRLMFKVRSRRVD